MARIRTIKPEFFSHEQLAEKSAHARLLAIGLLTLADCEGRLRWVPMQVHSQVFPWEASVKIEVLLGELIDVGYVVHYEVAGKRYVEIRNFKLHQRLSGKEAAYQSRLPAPPEKPRDLPSETGEAPGEKPGASPGSSGNPLGTGEQGNHRNRGIISLSDKNPTVDEFAIRWNSRPGIKPISRMTTERRRKLAVRLRDPDWPWREAIDKLPLPSSPGMDWQPDFDYFVANETNAVKIVEGKFDWRANAGRKAPAAGPGQNYDPNYKDFGHDFLTG